MAYRLRGPEPSLMLNTVTALDDLLGYKNARWRMTGPATGHQMPDLRRLTGGSSLPVRSRLLADPRGRHESMSTSSVRWRAASALITAGAARLPRRAPPWGGPPSASRATPSEREDQDAFNVTRAGAARSRLPRALLSSSRPPRLGRPAGVACDQLRQPRPSVHSQGPWRLRGNGQCSIKENSIQQMTGSCLVHNARHTAGDRQPIDNNDNPRYI
jgi:hypothetical protein